MMRLLKVPVIAALLCFVNLAFCSCSKNEKPGTPSTPSTTPDTPATTKPLLAGRLVYHSYSCYDCNDSKLYLYDFATNTNTLLSSGWAIDNPMNGHFSADGTSIVFMGLQKGTSNWDVFLWKLGSSEQPVNLTAALGNSRDEDPKFSHKGDRIVFKHNGHLAEMDLTGAIKRTVTSGAGEQSMPYYSSDDSTILYAEGGGAASDIFMIGTTGSGILTAAAVAGVQEYYPIGRDSLSFFYTRWKDAANENDQLYLGFYDGLKQPVRLPFNTSDANFSDAYPCGSDFVLLSGTQAGGRGGYDLYIANINSGKVWSLSLYNAAINSDKEELGAAYYP